MFGVEGVGHAKARRAPYGVNTSLRSRMRSAYLEVLQYIVVSGAVRVHPFDDWLRRYTQRGQPVRVSRDTGQIDLFVSKCCSSNATDLKVLHGLLCGAHLRRLWRRCRPPFHLGCLVLMDKRQKQKRRQETIGAHLKRSWNAKCHSWTASGSNVVLPRCTTLPAALTAGGLCGSRCAGWCPRRLSTNCSPLDQTSPGRASDSTTVQENGLRCGV